MTDTIVVPQHLTTAVKQAVAPYGIEGGRVYNDKTSTHRRRLKWECCNPNFFTEIERDSVKAAITAAVERWHRAHEKPYIECEVLVGNAYSHDDEWTSRGGIKIYIQETC